MHSTEDDHPIGNAAVPSDASRISLADAEIRAENATRHAPFAVNLKGVRRQVEEILTQFGRFGFYNEYTRHDIVHVVEMLKMLDWMIPKSTKALLTDADWFITVLSIYFHDLGLVITPEEFANRNNTGFPEFCNDVLFVGSSGQDYRETLKALPDDERERFLYQEFVRANHGTRVRHWIEGKADDQLGYAVTAINEISNLLQRLSPLVRRDIALVCESHNLDDLHDIKKYKISQPYGNSDPETANLQYCAVLLRTVDLLQITHSRAPTVVFKLINPSDPVSQKEWARQNAVTRVRPKLGLNKEGVPDESIPREAIEIFATFTDDNGFFGLISYLNYAKQQLAKSHDVVEVSNRTLGTKLRFPWKYIDEDHIEAEGFLKETFGFEIDQAKILDLLTGHTLYNFTTVVIRELIQNSIDAIRLQALIEHKTASEFGHVDISWNSTTRIIEVRDNGTGMSQSIIVRHLLKVGSSRYQDDKFREDFPTFSPISRFGIGVLSTFMIADTVDIITCHPEDEGARQISLRSVHGKYLIRLLDKATSPIVGAVVPHGTVIRLRVRASASQIDVLDAVAHWVVVPGCGISVKIDDNAPVRVGFRSPKDAIKALLRQMAFSSRVQIKVVEKELDGVTLA